MSALEPSHPGEAIQMLCLDDCGITVAQAAAHMAVAEQELADVCATEAPMTVDLAIRVELAFGGSAKLWLALQANYDLAQARKRAGDLQITRIPTPNLEPVAGD